MTSEISHTKKLLEFVNYQPNAAPKYDSIKVSIDEQIKIEEIEFEGYNKEKVVAYLVYPDIEGPRPAIHFIHWLETNASNSNKDEFLPMAIELARKGFISILPDCFWSLDKEKFEEDPTQYTNNWWKTDFVKDSGVCKRQIINLISSHEVLLSLPNVDKSRIVIAAHDFGAMFSSLLPSFGFTAKTYIYMTATGRFTDWFKFGSKLSEDEFSIYLSQMDFLDPLNHISNLAPGPVLFQFADDDFYVPKNKAEELFNEARHPKEIRWYTAKHPMNDNAFEDMKDWILEKA